MPRGKQKTHEEFAEELRSISPSISIEGTYIKGAVPIKCKCQLCGHIWSPTPKTLLKGVGCPQCANKIRLTHEEFLEKLTKSNSNYPDFEVLTQYKGMASRITCKCKTCSTVWNPKANDLVRAGSGCPQCSGNLGFTHKQFLNNSDKFFIQGRRVVLAPFSRYSMQQMQ